MNRLKVDMPLFRGKCLDNNEWVYGSLLTFKDAVDGYSHIIVPQKDANLFSDGEGYKESDLGVEVWYRVDPETVGQYTGLKDKNGVKIFEGNVVKGHHYNNGVKKRIVGRVMFRFNGWDIAGVGKYVWDITRLTSACEVIGNTHDNPELLEVD